MKYSSSIMSHLFVSCSIIKLAHWIIIAEQKINILQTLDFLKCRKEIAMRTCQGKKRAIIAPITPDVRRDSSEPITSGAARHATPLMSKPGSARGSLLIRQLLHCYLLRLRGATDSACTLTREVPSVLHENTQKKWPEFILLVGWLRPRLV